MTDAENQFGARATLSAAGGEWGFYRIGKLEEEGVAPVSRLPYSIRILLEAALRQCDGFEITGDDVERIARWSPETAGREEIPFKPARVVMQDFTGVPAVVDLAAMRDAMAELGGDPKAVNPRIPVDLVIDHSVQVDYYGLRRALELNAEREFGRNRERYEFLRWGPGGVRQLPRRPAGHRDRPPGQPRVPRLGGAGAAGRRRRGAAGA